MSRAGKAETDIKERSRNTGGKGNSGMEKKGEGDAAENGWSIKHGQKKKVIICLAEKKYKGTAL